MPRYWVWEVCVGKWYPEKGIDFEVLLQESKLQTLIAIHSVLKWMKVQPEGQCPNGPWQGRPTGQGGFPKANNKKTQGLPCPRSPFQGLLTHP